MKQKFAIIFTCAVLALSGCGATSSGTQSAGSASKTDAQTVAVLDTMDITLPGGWLENTENHPFDLQYVSPDETCNTGVFFYNADDVTSYESPAEVFAYHIDQIRENRPRFELTASSDNTSGGRTITTSTYIGERNGSENYYVFSLVEFEGADCFAVVLQACIPEAWSASEPLLAEIVDSCALRG